MSKARIVLESHPSNDDQVSCRVLIDDPDLIGHDAKLTLERVVHVKDSSPVHKREQLWSKSFKIDQNETRHVISRQALGRGFAYQGQQIEIRLESTLSIDDSILFDTKVKGLHQLRILDRPKVDGKAQELAEPADSFNFFANLKAIPPRNRLLTLGLSVVGGLVVLANALLGLHDQFTPESATIFYSHSSSDGESQSPLMMALMGSGAAGAAIWFAIRLQLRKYMSFEFATLPGSLDRSSQVAADSLIRGKARVPLERITVRVVAYNREHGQYIRGSGTDRRTVSFSSPVRAIKLYEKFIPYVPARSPIQSYLDGQVDFEEMFRSLYPPFKLGSNHGLDVAWEAQLLHPEFVDHELNPGETRLEYQDFLDD